MIYLRMLRLDDDRWNHVTGGYKTPFDPRTLLGLLETCSDVGTVWQQLWAELYHQGDVGDASYAAVPHIVRIYRQRGVIDWNAYAMLAIIELARTGGKNADVPEWLASDYFEALQTLAETGLAEITRTDDHDTVGAILSIIAITKGLRTHGRFLVEYSEDELLNMESGV